MYSLCWASVSSLHFIFFPRFKIHFIKIQTIEFAKLFKLTYISRGDYTPRHVDGVTLTTYLLTLTKPTLRYNELRTLRHTLPRYTDRLIYEDSFYQRFYVHLSISEPILNKHSRILNKERY